MKSDQLNPLYLRPMAIAALGTEIATDRLGSTEQMVKLYQKGYSTGQIGAIFGISRQAVFLRFKTIGFKMRELPRGLEINAAGGSNP